ncbi:MAG: cyclophilin-like family protein [Halobacteria archaeon]
MVDLVFELGYSRLKADWVERNGSTRGKIDEALPFEGVATRWGDEFYFEIPVDAPAEFAVRDVEVGDVAYWPRGNSLCVFWGETPASVDDGEPRAASEVNVVASVKDTSPAEDVEDGTKIRVTRG